MLVYAHAPPRTMDTLLPLPDDSYIGYSIHCSDAKSLSKVRKIVQGAAVARANEMTILEFSDFICLKPERVLNRNTTVGEGDAATIT